MIDGKTETVKDIIVKEVLLDKDAQPGHIVRVHIIQNLHLAMLDIIVQEELLIYNAQLEHIVKRQIYRNLHVAKLDIIVQMEKAWLLVQ